MAKSHKPGEDPVVAQAFDPTKNEKLVRAIQQLSPDEAAVVLVKLEAAFKKRKLQAVGYMVAIVAWFIGMLCAFAIYATVDGFVSWILLMPFALVGVVLFVFGKLADRAGAAANEPPVVRE